jgi:Trk K+ transport system NAD-binding subunit
MRRTRDRLLTLLAILPIVVLLSALLYRAGMARFEGQERDFWSALMFAAETITTTGYGADTAWSHPAMVLFVVGLQFMGVVLIYMIVPMVLIPFLEERFEARLPRRAPKMSEHVVIYRYGPAVETLCQELTETATPLVIIEHDEQVARRLLELKLPVVYADGVGAALANVHLEKARAVIANGSDEANATMMLVAQQLGFKGEVLALIEEPYHRKPITLAGASAAYTPRHMLGAALAARASRRISPRVSGIQQIGRKLQVSEIPIGDASELAGKTLAEAMIGKRTGVTVIGQWIKGRLETQPAADMVIEPRGILVSVGNAESLDRLTEIASGGRGQLKREGAFIVAGYGEVGRKVGQLLGDAGEEVRVIDLEAGPGVDVVGDVLEPGVLEAAGVTGAQAVILALDSDSATLFATVIVKDQAPDVTIIARVNQAENVERLHHAGADFALSISQVSGQILAHRLLRREAIAIDPQLRLLKASGSRLAGLSAANLNVRQKTGCSIVAVERGDDLIVELGSEFRFEKDDFVYACGTNAATLKFASEYG